MRNIQDLLVEIPFFRQNLGQYLDSVAACAKNTFFPEGEFLAHEGDDAVRFYLIRRGLVSVEIHQPTKEPHVIQTLSINQIAGWSWLFPPHKWQFDLRAMEPTSAIAFNGACIRNKCENDPTMGYLFMKEFAKIMTERLGMTRLQLLNIYGGDYAYP